MNKEEYYKCLREYEEEHVCINRLLSEYIEFLDRRNICLTSAERYYDSFFEGYGNLSDNTVRVYRGHLNKFTRFVYYKDKENNPHKLVKITGQPLHEILGGGLIL